MAPTAENTDVSMDKWYHFRAPNASPLRTARGGSKKVDMPTSEEFEALVNRVSTLEANLNRVASSYKEVLEQHLPEVTNTLGNFIKGATAVQADNTSKLMTLADAITKLADNVTALMETVQGIQDELDLRADLSLEEPIL